MVKEGRPIPTRFPVDDERRVRMHGIASGLSVSAAIRDLVRRGLKTLDAPAQREESPAQPRRRVLSRGVMP